MSPDGGGEPTGVLAEKMNEAFGSFEQFKNNLLPPPLANLEVGGRGSLKKTGIWKLLPRPIKILLSRLDISGC